MEERNFLEVRQALFEKIRKFENNLNDKYEVIANVSGQEMVLEGIGEVEKYFFEFWGTLLDHSMPINIYIKYSDLLLTLTAQPRPVNQGTKRRPIFLG